jgi:DNA-binding NarL/FixJ family response regulator
VTDPYPVSLGAVAALLRRSGVADRVHEAASAAEVPGLVRRLGAGLVVLATDADGPHRVLRRCRQLKESPDPPVVLVYSGTNDPAVVTASVASGADGFVHRSATEEQLVEAVRSVLTGRPVWFLGELRADRGTGTGDDPETAVPFARMTQREQQIFALLLSRYSNDEIAAELHLARQTVKNHVSSVLQKTGFANRRELAKLRRLPGAPHPVERLMERTR